MQRKPPVPVCNVFLVCREIHPEPDGVNFVLVGQPTAHVHHAFPTAVRVGFFIRLGSAHGQYVIDVQLQNAAGDVVWRDGMPEPLDLADPLHTYNFCLKTSPVFPSAGEYAFVLVVNGEELSRQRFYVHRAKEPAER